MALSYSDYLLKLTQYLTKFYRTTHPLADFHQVEAEFKEQFEEEWQNASLFGWEATLKKMRAEPTTESKSLFC